MAPCRRRNLLEQGKCFLVRTCFTLGKQSRKNCRVIVDNDVRNQPCALVADVDFDIGSAGQFIFATDLGDS